MLGYYNTKFHGLIIPFNTIFLYTNFDTSIVIIEFFVKAVLDAHSKLYLILRSKPEAYHYYQ